MACFSDHCKHCGFHSDCITHGQSNPFSWLMDWTTAKQLSERLLATMACFCDHCKSCGHHNDCMQRGQSNPACWLMDPTIAHPGLPAEPPREQLAGCVAPVHCRQESPLFLQSFPSPVGDRCAD